MRKTVFACLLLLILSLVFASCAPGTEQNSETAETAPTSETAETSPDPSTTTQGDRRVDPFDPDPTEPVTKDPVETKDEPKTGVVPPTPPTSSSESGVIPPTPPTTPTPPTSTTTTAPPSSNQNESGIIPRKNNP